MAICTQNARFEGGFFLALSSDLCTSPEYHRLRSPPASKQGDRGLVHLWHAAGCLGQSPDESEAEGADRIVVAQLVQQQCEKGTAC